MRSRFRATWVALVLLASLVLTGVSPVLAPSASARWPFAGGQVNSLNGRDPAIADVGGQSWVTWAEQGAGGVDQILVSRLVGGTWTPVGGALSTPDVHAMQPAITAVDGVAYVAWAEDDDPDDLDAVRVSRWNGSAWVPVGSSLLDSDVVLYSAVSITSVGSSPAVPYVAFAAQPDGVGVSEVRVQRFVSGAWQPVGGALNTTASRDAKNARLTTVGGAPVIAFDQVEDDSGRVAAHVARWSGSAWTAVGGGVGGNDFENAAQGIVELDGQPALLHLDQGQGGAYPSLVLSRWTGSTWTDLGPPLGETNHGTPAALTVSNGVPFVSWVYTSDIYYVTGARFNGQTWVSTGDLPIGEGGTFGIHAPALADVAGVPRVVWQDYGNGALTRIYSAEYSPDPEYDDPGFDRAWGRDAVLGYGQGFEICTLAYRCQRGDAELDEDDQGGSVFAVGGTAVDPDDGSVWIADTAVHRLAKFGADGTFERVVGYQVTEGGANVCVVEEDCVAGTAGTQGGRFDGPTGIAVAPNGHVFVTDRANNRVQELDASGAFVRAFGAGVAPGSPGFGVCTVASSCTAGTSGDEGGALDEPIGLAVGADGSVYVSDAGGRVTKYITTPSNVTFDRTWGGDVVPGGGTGAEVCTVAVQCQEATHGGQAGAFGTPVGVAVHDDQVFVLDGGDNARVQVFGTDGTWQRAWGKGVAGAGFSVCSVAAGCQGGASGGLGGELDLTEGSEVGGTDGISVGPGGAVYVADFANSRIQVYSSSGVFKKTWGRDVIAGNPGTGYEVCTVAADCKTGEYGERGGELDRPQTVDAGSDMAVVGDTYNLRVQTFKERPGATFAFSSAAYTKTENGGSAQISVTRGGDLSAPVQVSYETSGGSATAGTDYTTTTGTLVFAAGETSKSFGVPVLDDEIPESPDETVGLQLSDPDPGDLIVEPSTATLTIGDDDAVNTTITSGPAGLTNQSQPSFGFTSSTGGASFECLVDSNDAGGFGPCTNPWQVPSPLSEGPHFVYVRAVLAGQPDPTPARRDFVVDTVAPVTTLTEAPGPQSGNQQIAPHVFVGIVKVTASVVDAHDTTTRCQVDGSAPATYAAMAAAPCPVSVFGAGTHRVYAASMDEAGNTGPVTSTTFEILAEPNTIIDSGPSGEVFLRNPYFGFHSTIAGSTFECRIDEGAFARCTNPYVSSPLAIGPHSFQVRSTSPDGVVDPTPALRAFTVGSVRTVSDDCSVVDVPTNIYAPSPHGCLFGGHIGACPSDKTCVRTNLDCPVYSRCSVTLTANLRESDPEAHWKLFVDTYAGRPPFGTSSSFLCETGKAGVGCRASVTATTIGDPRSDSSSVGPTADCAAWVDGPVGRSGPADDRRLSCHASLRAEPAVVADPVASAGKVQALVPGAGVVTLTTGGGGKRAARAAAGSSTTTTVSAAGVVTMKPKLPKKLRKKLKSGKKVKVKVTLAYRSPEGTTLRVTRRLVLRKDVKVKEGPRVMPRITTPW